MATGSGRGRGRTGGTTTPTTGTDNQDRVKVGVAWINGNNAETYLADMVADKIYLRYSMDIEQLTDIPEDWNILAFPNKNKVGQAPDFDFVALPPRPQQT